MMFSQTLALLGLLIGVSQAVQLPQQQVTNHLRKLQDDLMFDPADTAIVITDPQNDFLSPDGVTWGVVGPSVVEHHTRENIGRLFVAARDLGYTVFISPHYYYPYDHDWEFGGFLEQLMHNIGMFDRDDPLSLDGFEGSGADWLEPYKEFIAMDNVIVVSPHKVYGPEQNDLALQLRKRNKDRVILAGMSANLCVEAHLRDLLEVGFEVAVVEDATAAATLPDRGDGYEAALTNFKFIANAVIDTDTAITAMGGDPLVISDFDLQLKHRITLQFVGAASDAGSLADVNARFGTSANPVTTFGMGNYGDFIACVELPMINPATQLSVGTGVDCLWGVDGGVAAISFFDFADNCGVLVHSGFTSLGAMTDGVGTGPVVAGGPTVDTMSGATSTHGSNSIIDGTRGFALAVGNVRVSGALHMGSTPNYFNCLWEIELDNEPSCGLPNDRSSSRLFTDRSTITEARKVIETPAGGETGDSVAFEEKVAYHTGHALVKFDGKATAIGSLNDANQAAGVDITLEDAFGSDVGSLGDFLGCHMVAMQDLNSQYRVGTGIDCLWGVEGGVAAISYYATGMGVIVNSGLTSVAEFTDGVGNGPVLGNDPNSPKVAAMTGSFPPAVDANTFIATTGMYEGFKGNIRLSGAVLPGEPFYFNCVWDMYLMIPADGKDPMLDDSMGGLTGGSTDGSMDGDEEGDVGSGALRLFATSMISLAVSFFTVCFLA